VEPTVSGSLAGPGPAPLRACVFALAGQQLAADIRHTREVVVFPERTVVPLAPAHVVGVANLRGQVVPIVDIRPLLGLPGGVPEAAPRTIVLEDAGVQVAVVTDGVLGLEAFDEVLPAGEMTARTCGELALGLLRRGEDVATLLDVPRLVATLRVVPSARLPVAVGPLEPVGA
jgi:purine-binding chemotaxis protein CheW